MRVEMENISKLPPFTKRLIIYTSVAYIGIMLLVGAQLEVSLHNAPVYDEREVIAGAALALGGTLAAVIDKVYQCCTKPQLLPI